MKAEGEMKLVLSSRGASGYQLYVQMHTEKPFAAEFMVNVLCYCDTVRQAREFLAFLHSLGAEVEVTQVVRCDLGEVDK